MQWRALKIFAVGVALLVFGLVSVAQIQPGPTPQGPTITAIDFPSRIEPNGQFVSGNVQFQAPKSDVTQIEFKIMQAIDSNGQDIRKTSDIQDASWDPGVKGKNQGSIPFNLATRMVQRVTIAVTLIGTESGRGPSKPFAFVADFPPPGMVLIPAGSFQMGDTFGEGDFDERPVHTVFVSAFYMDKYEVTKALWDEVATWAAANGYDIKASDGSGKAGDHPVSEVSWYEAVKWVNARSEKAGLTPCYYTDETQGTVYRTGQIGVRNDWVKWTGCGYRLPTEAEWEKAARGGRSGDRFPWSDTETIQHARANYFSSSAYSYDTSPTRGFHPTYAVGSQPYTSPVGSFAPNGYGLYDMAGNVWEWTWDWYSNHWC